MWVYLKDYIGVKWKNAATPASGLYINQLPGISLKSIDQIANEDQVDFLGVWDDVQTRSLTKFRTAVQQYFGRNFTLRRIAENILFPDYVSTEESQYIPASPSYQGFTYDLGWYGSDLAACHVEQLRLYLLVPQASVAFKVFRVINQNTKVEIDSFEATNLVAGWNTIKVAKDYWERKIFVCYDATNITAPFQPLSSALNGGPYTSQTWIWPYPYSPYQAIVRGGASPIDSFNLNETNQLYGLAGNAGTTCSFDGIVTARLSNFTSPWWYLLGAELMIERIYSERINRFTTVNLKQAQELRIEFEHQFENELDAALRGIHQLTQDGCVDCNAQVRLEHSLP